jgi:hypothetical protein
MNPSLPINGHLQKMPFRYYKAHNSIRNGVSIEILLAIDNNYITPEQYKRSMAC